MRRWVKAVVSCGGAGYVPVAPGTAGALVGTAIACFTETAPAWQWGLLAAAWLLGFWLIPAAQRAYGAPDPTPVVLDECCGALVTFAGLPLTPAVVIVGFVAFRVFDITKPFGIHRLERLPGAVGVLADDLAAGLLARLVVWFVA